MANNNFGFKRVPGLYRLWDLQFMINRTDAYQVHYIETSEAGTPLFALYHCLACKTREVA